MGRDRAVFVGMMVARLGFVLSLVIGLGWLLGLYNIDSRLHLGTGVLTVLSILLVAVRLLMTGKGGGATLAAGLLGAAGALVGISATGRSANGLIHLVIMVAMLGLAEMTVARAKRQA